MSVFRIITGILLFSWSMPESIEFEKLSLRGAKNSFAVKDVVDFDSPKAPRNEETDVFHEYRALSGKVLYSAAEQIRLRVLLSSSELIRQAYLDLLDPQSQEEIRFERLDYFERAMAWTENPIREKIVKALEEILLSDNFLKLDNIEQRKSIVGDKIEICGILKQFAPLALKEIAELSKDVRINKMIAYAENIHNSHHKAINL